MIDLYQHHEEDPDTPFEETFGTLDELVAAGTIRAYGTSNTDRRHCGARGRSPAAGSSRSRASTRGSRGTRRTRSCLRAGSLGLGFIPYFPLASGLLTGKVTRDRPPAEGTRLYGRQIDEARLDRVERLRAWADAHGRTLLEVAIGGLAAVSPVVSVIAGATKPGTGPGERGRFGLGADAGRARRTARRRLTRVRLTSDTRE